MALNIGGDDYIEKPYSLGVLLAKVRVVLKRFSNTAEKKEDIFTCGDIRIDRINRQLFVADEEKKLTNLEFNLLSYLVDNKDRLITKTELFDNVWKDKFTSDGTLNVHIRKLREAIEKDPQNPAYIVTVWKEGYKFISGGK